MVCKKCGKNEATFYYRENVNGKEKAYRLCPSCMAEMQKSGEIRIGSFGDDPLSKMMKLFSGDNFFSGEDLFGKLIGYPQKNQPEVKKTCSFCGGSFQDMVRSGRAGCPTCYETFAAELAPSIRRIHGRTNHTGQVPAGFREENEKKQKIAALETELKEAIEQENYERAAEIRDSLRDLRNV